MPEQLELNSSTYAILDSSTEFAIIVMDTRGRIMIWNEGARRLMIWEPHEMVGQTIHRIFTPEDVAAGIPEKEMGTALEGGRSPDERWHLRKDGSRFWGSGMMTPLRTEKGEIIGFVKIVRDLTERKEAEERQRLLTAELQHRIKNILAMVHSIAVQTLGSDEGLKDAREAFTARLEALTHAHDILTEVSWTPAPIVEIIKRALGPHIPLRRERIQVKGPEYIQIDARSALALLLILHELATNAVKYGALSNDVGTVVVQWDVGAAESRLSMEWQEQGGPPVAEPKKKGFGSRLVQLGLKSQGGSAKLFFDREGLRCTIDIPIEAR
jgi:PAS domain S-box-containing protein